MSNVTCSVPKWHLHWAGHRPVQLQLGPHHPQLLHHVQVHSTCLPSGLCFHVGHRKVRTHTDLQTDSGWRHAAYCLCFLLTLALLNCLCTTVLHRSPFATVVCCTLHFLNSKPHTTWAPWFSTYTFEAYGHAWVVLRGCQPSRGSLQSRASRQFSSWFVVDE